MIEKKLPAVIFGLSETGLAIGRSLGKLKIKVYGISYAKEIGYYSKYIKGYVFSHPRKCEAKFKDELKKFCEKLQEKSVLFIASDEYLAFYQNNSSFVHNYFHSTLPDAELVKLIQDKYSQHNMAVNCGIDVPKTVFVEKIDRVNDFVRNFNYPVFIKARDVNIWRKKISSHKKGFVINTKQDLIIKLSECSEKQVPVIVQEIVKSPDNENYKVCVFISPSGKLKLLFTIRKIHQRPIHFGIGTCMMSYKNEYLNKIGEKLFTSINYTGVGSAEFKFDKRDGKLKLIEINSRYWQQNALADFCGMNFPLTDYLEATGQNPLSITDFEEGLKYLNFYSDYLSYKDYKKNGEITFRKWVKDVSGRKVISFLYKDDFSVLIHYLKKILLKRLSAIKKRRKNEKKNSNTN